MDKPEQEERALCFEVDPPSLSHILNLGAQSEIQIYLLEVISRHDSSFWDPSLWNRAVKHSFPLLPETTSPHLGGSPTTGKLQPDRVFLSVNKLTYILACQCLDSKSHSYPPYIKHLDQSYLSVHMGRRISVINGAWRYGAVWWGTNVNVLQKQFEQSWSGVDVLTTNISMYLQPRHYMRRRFNTEWSGNGKRERGGGSF